MYLPPDICGDLALPNFPQIQDCTSYSQLYSEVAGVIFMPVIEGISFSDWLADGLVPGNWEDFDEWTFGNNTDANAHLLIGRGSFLETDAALLTLAGGRVEENRERIMRLTLNVLNMDAGHIEWGRKLQRNARAFQFWVYTNGGRIIGGQYGMKPYFTNAIFAWQQGRENRESMQLIIDTEILSVPEW